MIDIGEEIKKHINMSGEPLSAEDLFKKIDEEPQHIRNKLRILVDRKKEIRRVLINNKTYYASK